MPIGALLLPQPGSASHTHETHISCEITGDAWGVLSDLRQCTEALSARNALTVENAAGTEKQWALTGQHASSAKYLSDNCRPESSAQTRFGMSVKTD